MEIFYDPKVNSSQAAFLLDAGESKHMIRVLRYKPGKEVKVTNGRGELFTGTFAGESNKQAEITGIKQERSVHKTSEIHLAVAPVKNKDRNEWLIEKAVESGVSSIHYFVSERTVKSGINLSRAEKIAISAMKQSGQLFKPEIHAPVSFEKMLSKLTGSTQTFIASQHSGGSLPLWEKCNAGGKIFLIIGPEGDFSEKELDYAMKMNVQPVWLGPNRLRTETAALAGLFMIHVIQYQAGYYNI